MLHTPRQLATLAVAVIATLVAACDSNDSISNVVPNAANVAMEDQCDPASFNAALGAGTCTRQGNVTLDQFNAELAATGQVASWRFVPSTLTIGIGRTIIATNVGGEVHTFTRVAQFGGGINDALNTASNNPVEAPECAALSARDMVSPGGSFITLPSAAAGTNLYQCCIHPWMRATVTVDPTVNPL